VREKKKGMKPDTGKNKYKTWLTELANLCPNKKVSK